MTARTLIHDGDHGGDDFITTLMILGRPDLFDLRAITSNFGNVPLDLAADNALRALALGGRTDIPVYKGAEKPFRTPLKGGDDAHGENGIGGAVLPLPAIKPQDRHAVDVLIETLENAPDPITICPTGPLTNMALVLERAPHLKSKIEKLIIMGGGGGPGIKGHIKGNITKFAEFNFYMDPDAADYVLQSGVNLVLHGLSTTHQLLYAPDKHHRITSIAPHGETLSTIMRAAEHLDQKNFGENGAYIHDENTVCYLAHPELYDTKRVHLSVNTDPDSPEVGNLIIGDEDPHAPTELVTNLNDPDAAFDFIADCLQRLFRS